MTEAVNDQTDGMHARTNATTAHARTNYHTDTYRHTPAHAPLRAHS